MSDSNGILGRIGGGLGGTVIDRRFGSLLVIHDGVGGDVAIDVDRVVQVVFGQGVGPGGAQIPATVIVLEGSAQPSIITSRGVVAVAEAIDRARKGNAEEKRALSDASAREVQYAGVKAHTEIAGSLTTTLDESMEQLGKLVEELRGEVRTFTAIAQGDPTADVEGRAARAAAAGGGSGIAGTTIAGGGLQGEPLGAGENPHLAALERDGEIAKLYNEPEDQAAAQEEAAQKRDAGTK